MKKEIKYCMVMAAAAMAFTACSSEETVDNSGPVEARVTAGVSGPQTRAADDVWEQDEIGVMVTGVTGTTEGVESQMKTLYQNVKYTTTATSADAAAFTSTDGIYFQDANETVTFAAYGPYKTSNDKGTLPGTNGVVTGSTSSQSTRESQKDFDYIYASGATASQSNPAVEFSDEHAFQHKMTRLIIIVKTGDGFTASDVAGSGNVYSLKGLNHSGQFDVVKGEAKATTGTATTTDEYWSLSDNSLLTKDDDTNPTQYTFTSILYPQENADLIFKANIDSQEYTTPSGKIAPGLETGNSYTYTVTVNKTGVTVSGCTVEKWSVGTGGDASATM